MIFTCISTGSTGNGYLLETDKSVLIIEAGKGMFKKILANIPNDKKLIGAIYTHKHSDHFGDIERFSKVTTIIETDFKDNKYEDEHFIIKEFEVLHNVKCNGLAIFCKEERKTFIFITDFARIIDKSIYGLTVDFLAIELSYNQMIFSQMTEAEKFGLTWHSNDFHTIEVIKKLMKNNPKMKVVTIHKSERACNYALTNRMLFQNFGLQAEIITEGRNYKF